MNNVSTMKLSALICGTAGIVFVVEDHYYKEMISVIIAASNFIVLGILLAHYPPDHNRKIK